MKTFKTLFNTTLILMTLLSCSKKQETAQNHMVVEENNLGGGVTTEPVPMLALWQKEDLPVSIVLSDQFTPDETAAVKTMSEEWNRSIEESNKAFFKVSEGRVANFDPSNLEDYADHEKGIYISRTNFPKNKSHVLAFTRLVGEVYVREGNNPPIMVITHGDIIINKRDHHFEDHLGHIEDLNSYDFHTVILHELGHFLGLEHESYFYPSVMEKQIDTHTIHRSLYEIDEENIRMKYLGREDEAPLKSHLDKKTKKKKIILIFELTKTGKCGRPH